MSDADVIIQSCDLVNFRVHKRTLAMSSQFFDDMFSLPQPQPSDKEVVNGLPVLRLAEDAEVLNGLISMLYPIPSVLSNSYDKFLALLAASQKYDMVGVRSHIRAEMQSRKFSLPIGREVYLSYAISSISQTNCHRSRVGHYVISLIFEGAAETISCRASSRFSNLTKLRSIFGFLVLGLHHTQLRPKLDHHRLG